MASVGALPFRVLLLGAGVTYLAIGVRARDRRESPAGRPFVAMAILAGLSAVWLSAPLFVPAVDPTFLLLAPLYLLPVGVAAFALEYTGYVEVRSNRYLLFLAAPAAWGVAYNYLVWGRQVQGTLFAVLQVGGIVAVLSLAFVAAMAVAAVGLLAWSAYRYDYVDSVATGLLAVGGAGPWIAAVVVFRLDSFVELGTLSSAVLPAVYGVGFGISAVALAGAVRFGRVFDRVPASGNLGPETVLREMADPVLVLDDDGRVVRTNPVARETLLPAGSGPGTELVDVVGYDLGQLRSKPNVELAVDGDRREFEHTVSTIADQHDRVVGHSLVLHDVTEREGRKRRIRELERTRRQLERKNERLDQFASVVSHDLRNPLNVALGSVGLVRERDDEADVDRIEGALERMDDIIDDVLVLARTGADVEDTAPVELGEVVEAAWDNVRTGRSKLRRDGDLPTVEADRDRLLHLFENLFRNAVEHGSTSSRPGTDDAVEHGSTSSPNPHGEGEGGEDGSVVVGVGPLASDDGETAGFFVADDGTGIPESDREAVFDHGYTTSDDGTGFGLSIVEDVVDAHGWEVRVTESSGGGARFEVRTR